MKKKRSYTIDKAGNQIPSPDYIDFAGNVRKNEQPNYADDKYNPIKTKTTKGLPSQHVKELHGMLI